jgi:PhnB protein
MSILKSHMRLPVEGQGLKEKPMSTAIATTLQPIPYLAFNGNCEEAMRFYEATLGGEITVMMRAKDTPCADQMPAEYQNSIMNAQLRLPGGGLLYAGDYGGCSGPYEGIKGVTITLNYPTVAEGEKAFNAISEGGTVSMPWSPTFWAKAFGMCVDKFGTPWIINGELVSL